MGTVLRVQTQSAQNPNGNYVNCEHPVEQRLEPRVLLYLIGLHSGADARMIDNSARIYAITISIPETCRLNRALSSPISTCAGREVF